MVTWSYVWVKIKSSSVLYAPEKTTFIRVLKSIFLSCCKFSIHIAVTALKSSNTPIFCCRLVHIQYGKINPIKCRRFRDPCFRFKMNHICTVKQKIDFYIYRTLTFPTTIPCMILSPAMPIVCLSYYWAVSKSRVWRHQWRHNGVWEHFC